MTRALVAIFLAVESLDLALYLQAPALETGVLAPFPAPVVAVAKVAAVTLVVLFARALRPSSSALVLGVGIAIGAFGAGTAAATLAMVR